MYSLPEAEEIKDKKPASGSKPSALRKSEKSYNYETKAAENTVS